MHHSELKPKERGHSCPPSNPAPNGRTSPHSPLRHSSFAIPWVFGFFVISHLLSPAQESPVRGEDFVRAPAVADGLCLHNAFQTNMVLQRDKPVTVRGWAAAPKNPVALTFAGQTVKTTAADDRSFSVTLPATPANSAPQSLTVQSAGTTLTLENILVGDVWLLGGQSNMEFDLAKIDDGMLEIVSANFPQIRLLTVPRGKGFGSVASFERLDEWSSWSSRHFAKGDWEVCTPETVREFSAIGYVFGRRLAMATGVPIGLVDASVGGTTVETWTPEEVIGKVAAAETKDLLQDWSDRIAAFDSKTDLETRIANYHRNREARAKRGDPLPADSVPPSDLRPGPVADRNRPGYCYASMIRPLEGISVKGALFHQGYNNCFNGSAGTTMYRQVFPHMISAWRKAFADPGLPFCVISLCTAGDPQTEENFARPMYDAGPFIREAQHQAYRQLRESGDETIGFVSSFDLRKSWYHPQIKVPAGERAAKWALATQYEILTGRDAQLYWQPPSITETHHGDGTIRLTFDTEIKTADDSDGKMLGFAVAGDDGLWFPAEINHYTDGSVDNRNRPKYQRDSIVLSCPHVAEPKHYRYAWARNPMANLTNRFGIPVPTQRSDNWPLEQTVPGLTPPEGRDANSTRRWLGNNARKALEHTDLQRRLKEAQSTVESLTPVIEENTSSQ